MCRHGTLREQCSSRPVVAVPPALEDPVVLAQWTAGFFDGEGSVNIIKNKQNTTGREYHKLMVNVTQVMKDPLDMLQAHWGGAMRERHWKKPNWSCSWYWQVCDALAETFLRDIQPYAIVKARDIEIALRFRELKCVRGGVTGQSRGSPRQQDVHDAREALRLELLQRRSSVTLLSNPS